eukprot:TRINITY_DN1809_c0_g1_i2.p2 TRINITY_DN1809_c0_g1~~TRINITY_DN1809_c0_g1_i2.p2  ORF type:complete len:197 (+),score=6.28 TRINITY_DN1809_c0_g1_i2:306-896(+)
MFDIIYKLLFVVGEKTLKIPGKKQRPNSENLNIIVEAKIVLFQLFNFFIQNQGDLISLTNICRIGKYNKQRNCSMEILIFRDIGVLVYMVGTICMCCVLGKILYESWENHFFFKCCLLFYFVYKKYTLLPFLGEILILNGEHGRSMGVRILELLVDTVSQKLIKDLWADYCNQSMIVFLKEKKRRRKVKQDWLYLQ